MKTREAVAALSTTYHKLVSLVRFDKLNPPPQKDISGDFIWSEADLERARAALKVDRRRREHRQGEGVARA